MVAITETGIAEGFHRVRQSAHLIVVGRAMGNRGPGWDNYIALSYAAEQLFMAAQLLTSDTVPLNYAVQLTCERYLRGLVQHKDLLPGYVNTWIRECMRDCEKLRTRGSMTEQDVRDLAAAITNILDDVRGVIARLSASQENAA